MRLLLTSQTFLPCFREQKELREASGQGDLDSQWRHQIRDIEMWLLSLAGFHCQGNRLLLIQALINSTPKLSFLVQVLQPHLCI